MSTNTVLSQEKDMFHECKDNLWFDLYSEMYSSE